MPRAVRLLIYETETQDALDRQLGNSMADGLHLIPGGLLRTLTLPEPLITVLAALLKLDPLAVREAIDG